MGFWLFLAFVVIPAADLYGLIVYGDRLGFWPCLGLLWLAFVLGLAILRQAGLRLVQKATRELSYGRLPTDAVLDGSLLVLAGVWFMIPGFLTDVLALLLLFPPLRFAVRVLIKRRLRWRFAGGGGVFSTGHDGADELPSDPFENDWRQSPSHPKPDIEVKARQADPQPQTDGRLPPPKLDA